MSIKDHANNLRESYTSKKFWSFIFTVACMFGFAMAAARIPALTAMFDVFVGGVVAALGIYQTGNVMNKSVIGKSLPAKKTKKAVEPKLD